MHIAYILADHYIPVFGNKGASIHVQEMVKAFVSLGHQVTVFAACVGSSLEDSQYQCIEVKPDASFEHTLINTAKEDKRQVKEQRAINQAQRIEQAVISMARGTPFDLVYERYSLFSQAGIDVAQRLNIPAIVEVNSPLIEEQQQYRQLIHEQLALDIAHRTFTRAQAVIAVSQGVANYINSIASDNLIRPVEVIANAVDTQRFHPAISPALHHTDGKSKRIGFVGSLKPWHGIDSLLHAFKDLVDTIPGVKLVLIGDGPLRQWIDGFIQGADLHDSVSITGWIDHQTLPHYIKSLDIAVAPYPALSKFYFSPLKLFEYLAVGVPVVASRIGQIESVIKHGTSGLLFDPGNSIELTKAMHRLCTEKNLSQELAQQGPQAVQQHSWIGNARRVLDIAQPMIKAA